jgi:hypothetical protein
MHRDRKIGEQIPMPAGRSEPLHVATQTGLCDIEACAVWVGVDLLVWIWGGSRPHIGSVAAAQPRPSRKDAAVTSATASVLTYLGHKDDVTAKFAAEALAGALAVNVVVTAGIHWDNLAEAHIPSVMANARSLVDQLIAALASHR